MVGLWALRLASQQKALGGRTEGFPEQPGKGDGALKQVRLSSAPVWIVLLLSYGRYYCAMNAHQGSGPRPAAALHPTCDPSSAPSGIAQARPSSRDIA